MIASCLKMINEFQCQARLVKAMEGYLFLKYMENMNDALRHTNPTVRKQGEALFKTLYMEFGEPMLSKLSN